MVLFRICARVLDEGVEPQQRTRKQSGARRPRGCPHACTRASEGVAGRFLPLGCRRRLGNGTADLQHARLASNRHRHVGQHVPVTKNVTHVLQHGAERGGGGGEWGRLSHVSTQFPSSLPASSCLAGSAARRTPATLPSMARRRSSASRRA